MKFSILAMLWCLSMSTSAQILNKIKDKVTGKAKTEANNAKYEAKNKARQSAYKAVDDFKAEYDSTDIDYAILLSDNSGLFGGRAKNEMGTRFMRMAGIVNSLYKDADLDDEENARLNLHMGQSAYAAGHYMFAAKKLSTAQGYFEKAGMRNDLSYLKTIATEGLLFTSMGRFSQAEKFTVKALELREENLGKTNMAVAASLNNYAVLHYNLGQYNESEKEFGSAIDVINSNNQEAAMPYAILLNNQAILYQSMGRYDQAVNLLKQALQLAGKLEVSKAKNHLKFFSNLALLYQQMGKYAEAEEIYRGLEKRLERGKPEFANFLNNVAILAMLMKKEDKVELMLKQSAEIYKTSMTENSPAYAKVISDLGNFYRYKTRYTDAEPLLLQALQVREETLGDAHPLYAQSQEDLAILYWKKKDMGKAYVAYHAVMERSLDFVNRYFPPMSEAEKTKYWDMLSPRFERFYNFALEAAPSNKNVLNDMFEYRLATKGLLLSSTKKVSESILNSGSKELIGDYIEWLDSKEQLTAFYAYSKEDLHEQGINIDSLERVSNAMEKRLSESSKEFSQFFFTSKTKYSEVQRELKADEALVEMIRLRNFDQVLTDQSRYAALIVTKAVTEPRLVVMANGNDMEVKHAKAYRVFMKNKSNDEQSYNHFWALIEPEVKGKRKIYFSPDGVYTQINLYTLKKAGGDFLLNQYDLVLIGNPRDLVTNKNKTGISGSGKKATLLGFPDYGSGMIIQLPGTKVEVDAINKLLKTSGFQVSELIQREATETNLKSARKVSILHIATHGYFLKDVDKASWPIGVQADYAKDNVLLRSGLMLTGASEADKLVPGLDSSNNGIMTSYEAMNLDLKGTDLVVLSACETGLGEVKAGEGVYGLQRAFLVAGAEAIIMSLWKVDDQATQQLMSNFYTNWVKDGDRQKAFKQAQQQLMTKFKEPLYWGAFVMIED
ncbi:MAG TPA: CHAT domain-containing tetratricopeptide repeat protein [Chitinophagaceae bacterium]|nr:CHAT domain-containing tetratricopeptide repeat protein [Chitinophagaceae bacterium]